MSQMAIDAHRSKMKPCAACGSFFDASGGDQQVCSIGCLNGAPDGPDTTTVEDAKRAYVDGEIDELELEQQLETALERCA
jgi:hypothetical protein